MGGEMPWRSRLWISVSLPRCTEQADRLRHSLCAQGGRSARPYTDLSCQTPDAYRAIRMQLLQRTDLDFSTLQSRNPLRCRACRRQRRDSRNARHHRRAPDRLLIKPGLLPCGCIDDQLNALAFNEIYDVGAPFFYLVNTFHMHPCSFQHVRSARGRHQLESHIEEFASHHRNMALVASGDADEDGALRRQFLPRSHLSFGEGFSKLVGHTHDFARRLHLRPKYGIDAGKLVPGEHWGLHVVPTSGVQIGAALDELR